MMKCLPIVVGENQLICHLYSESDTLFMVQDVDSRYSVINDGEPVYNDRAGAPFTDEDHLREWVSDQFLTEEVEFIDEAPGSNDEDEEVPVEV